jgi:hypothetical protein
MSALLRFLPLQLQMVTGGVHKVLHKKGTLLYTLRLTASVIK